MPDVANVRIGACSVLYNGVNLGHTLGGITFTYRRETTDLVVDQYGSTPVDVAISGQDLTVEFTLAEPTAANIHAIINESDIATATTKSRVAIGGTGAEQLRQYAAQLILHPLKNAATDLSEDITIYKAVSVGDMALNFDTSTQRGLPVTMRALVDETYGSHRLLGHFGYTNIS